MTTGSHHMQAVWVAMSDRGNLVELVQSIYLLEDQRWVPRETVFLRPPAAPAGRRDTWAHSCIPCHSTGRSLELIPGRRPPKWPSLVLHVRPAMGQASSTSISMARGRGAL